ncbi:MAG: cytochrome c oxidase assembly protein [Pseudomonadota bacterium]
MVDAKQKTVMRLVGVVVVMGALAWASVPLYDLFCRVTGFGGTTNQRAENTSEILDQTIKVRFDASVASDMPWTFKPVDRLMEVRLGETGLAFYEAHNPTNKPIMGTASFNVTPYAAGAFFSKIQCFCFEEQILQPGETMTMPVSFFVDPEILTDREGQYVHTITLSYTFHKSDLEPETQAALETATPTLQ